MIDLYNIQDLMQHYKMYLNNCDKNTIDRIQELANADIEEVVHPTHEYPTFLYYIVLAYLDSLKNYAKFSDMSDDDKYMYVNDTIKEIRRVWELPVTQRMIEFLKETYNICMPYRNSWITDNTLNYTFNNINRKHLDDFETLCEMMGLKYESAEFVQHHQYEIKIFFNKIKYMTEKQFKTLRNGDKVRLPFSINPEQIIVDIVEKTGMITTSPEDDERAFYVNNYQDLEFVEKPVSTQSKEKSLILEMFTKFRKDGCDKCPFRIECDNTYSEIRMSTTDAFTICEALTMER